MNIDFAKYVPLGIDYKSESKWTLCGMGISTGYSLGFFFSYMSARNGLYMMQGNMRALRPGAIMEDFAAILGGYLNGFIIVILCMLALSAYHYVYHYQNSKSIYTMRRLPDRGELYRRCLALPAAAILVCILTALILMLLYFGVYMLCTPEECILPDQWQKIWDRSLIQNDWR